MDAIDTRSTTVSTARFLWPALTLVAALLTGSPATAAGSAEAGQAKAATCAACHGLDGRSANPEWPNLAGQNEAYLVRALQSFRSGARQNVLMTSQAMPLSDQDILDLAAWFASQKRAVGTTDPALLASGQRLFRGGNKDTGVPACLACHGPTGHGNGPAGWPLIAGQHATYAAAQLTAYRSKQRTTDGDTQMMRNVASAMTDDEIKAVTAYAQGLR